MLYLLIDHYNIDFTKNKLKDLLILWLNDIHNKIDKKIIEIKIRTYGGWNCKNVESEDRYTISAFYQNECPAFLSLSNKYYKISFEFAERLLLYKIFGDIVEADIRLMNTVVTRTSNQMLINIDNTCDNTDCELKKVKKWVKKKKACTSPTCDKNFSDFFTRREQKQVDIQLGLDLITCIDKITNCEGICILSNDQDFIPAYYYALFINRYKKLMHQIRTIDNEFYCDDYLSQKGFKIIKKL